MPFNSLPADFPTLTNLLKVTYPYIMAKVKIQAGTGNSDEDLPTPASASSKKSRKDGAIDLLTRIFKERGLTGWYQVRRTASLLGISF